MITGRCVLFSSIACAVTSLVAPAQDVAAPGAVPQAVAPQRASEQDAVVPVLEPDVVAAIQHQGFENSGVMRYLDELTNTIGHRLTGSDNFTRACEWGKRQFEDMGIAVELERWDTWPVAWNRGQWQGRVVLPVKMDLHVATSAWTAGTKGRVRAKLVREPRDAEQFEAVRRDLAGAFILCKGPRSAWIDEMDTFFEEHSIAGRVFPSSGSDEYPERMRVFGRPTKNPDRLPMTPQIMVRVDQAAELAELVDSGKDVIVEFDIRNRFRVGPIDLHNVIAEIPGTEKPEEVVVVCGHLDSWHQATGTTDNGTGTSTTLEVARILSAIGAKPKRTIRFCLWGGEEQHLLGSHGHVKRRRSTMSDVQIVFNHDAGTNWAQSLTVNAAVEAPLRRVFAPVFEMAKPDGAAFDGPVFELRSREKISGGGGSDHASFVSARVPAFAWGLRGRADYFGYSWHSQWDTFDVAIPEYQRHTATVIALAALGAANLPEKLSNEGIEPSSRSRTITLKDIMERALGVELGGNGDLTMVKVGEGKAKAMGFLSGDVLRSVGGEGVERLPNLRLLIRGLEGEMTKVGILRDGAEVVLEVKTADLRLRRRRGRRGSDPR